MPRVSSIVLAVALAAVGTGCGGGSSAGTPGASATTGAVQHPPSLVGVVGHNDAFTISLTDPSGTPITNLAAGTYSLQIKDESSIHNFHLTGPGTDHATGVSSRGTTTFSVTFTPGTYTFVCDPHASEMHGKFTVS